MAFPLSQAAAFALRQPLPLDDQTFLDRRRAFFRLAAARHHITAAVRQALQVLEQAQIADLDPADLAAVSRVFNELLPGLLGTGEGPVAARLARMCLELEEATHDFAAVLSAVAETYQLYTADQHRRCVVERCEQVRAGRL